MIIYTYAKNLKNRVLSEVLKHTKPHFTAFNRSMIDVTVSDSKENHSRSFQQDSCLMYVNPRRTCGPPLAVAPETRNRDSSSMSSGKPTTQRLGPPTLPRDTRPTLGNPVNPRCATFKQGSRSVAASVLFASEHEQMTSQDDHLPW